MKDFARITSDSDFDPTVGRGLIDSQLGKDLHEDFA